MPKASFRRVLNDGNQLLIGGVFRQVHRRADTQWNHNQKGYDDNVHGVENIRQDSDIPA